MIRKRQALTGLLLTFFLFAMASANGVTGDISQQTNGLILPDQGSYDTSMPFINDSAVVVDGQVDANEYGQMYHNEVTDITTYWEYNNEQMSIALQAPYTGWLAIGFGPSMEDSNILMAGVDDSSEAYCYDITGLPGFNHEDDVDEGGFDNIVSCEGNENATHTTVEFIFSYTPADDLDPIPEEDTIVPFFIGLNEDSDDKTRIHDAYDNNLKLYYKPTTLNMDVGLTLTGPEEVEQNEKFEVTVLVVDSNSIAVPNVGVTMAYRTSFGNYILGTGTSDSEGKVNFEISFENVIGSIMLVAISQEYLTVQDGTNISYLSSEAEMELTVEGEHEEEEPGYVVTSRWGLVAGFWFIGIVIWTTFGYNFYAIIQIFRHRNDGPVESDEGEQQSNEAGSKEAEQTTEGTS